MKIVASIIIVIAVIMAAITITQRRRAYGEISADPIPMQCTVDESICVGTSAPMAYLEIRTGVKNDKVFSLSGFEHNSNGYVQRPETPSDITAELVTIDGQEWNVQWMATNTIDVEMFALPKKLSILINDKEALCIDYSGDKIEFIYTDITNAGGAFVLWLNKYVNDRFELKEEE